MSRSPSPRGARKQRSIARIMSISAQRPGIEFADELLKASTLANGAVVKGLFEMRRRRGEQGLRDHVVVFVEHANRSRALDDEESRIADRRGDEDRLVESAVDLHRPNGGAQTSRAQERVRREQERRQLHAVTRRAAHRELRSDRGAVPSATAEAHGEIVALDPVVVVDAAAVEGGALLDLLGQRDAPEPARTKSRPSACRRGSR